LAWKSEHEYRLLRTDAFFNSLKEKNARKIKYQFDDLEGIIFGCRTSDKDKISIMKIIEKKCIENNRASFDFYQANFTIEGDFEIKKLDMIKFDNFKTGVQT
jgi:hypothetical protein